MNTHASTLIRKTRLHYPALLAILFLVTGAITRIVLQLAFPETLPFSGEMAPGLVRGFLNDLATLSFVLLLPATLLLLPQDTFMAKKAGKIYTSFIFFVFSSAFIFTAFAEFFFWDEFSSRFNFIAVDYLVYTTEVIQNIIESYPLFPLLSAVFVLSAAATFLMRYALQRIQKPFTASPGCEKTLGKRLITLSGLYLTAFLVFVFFSPFSGSPSRFWNEYAKNGVYELFSAYLHNQLDYRAFYKTMDSEAAFSIMRGEAADTDETFILPAEQDLLRVVGAAPEEKNPNVIIVIMESMSRTWLGEYTPHLNALAEESLSFTRMMSTGTRTVRGLEAVMLSIPPTPGNSIVRRPDNDKLFNLGTVFRNKGYDLAFIYSGVGFFDNMNAFFAANGYKVTDKLDFYPENKTFANAWGQCDEDLYSQSLAQADKSHAEGKLFQQVLLTTSNHRPYTYPEGKVALKSGEGRRGAIQYSDYAIGAFLRQAKTKPWFDNTIFVFVSDHPASIAGKTEVPADGYGIVCMMYGPKFFAPEKIDTLCSQIDVAPTLLASLGWGYTSPFFGTDARSIPIADGRAWISTYQLLGFRTDDRLVVLRPDGQAEVTKILPPSSDVAPPAVPAMSDDDVIDKAVASYQCAYDLFTGNKLKESVISTHMPQMRIVKGERKTP